MIHPSSHDRGVAGVRRPVVLVTGATGAIGRRVVEALVREGHLVLAGTRSHAAGGWPAGCQPIRMDVREPEIVLEAVGRSHLVLHLAAVVGNAACERDLEAAVAVNVDGTLNVLDAARVHGKPMIFASVANVQDDTPYAITKSTAERFCRMYQRERGVSVLPVRIFNAYGPGQPAESGKLVPSNVAKALRGEPLVCHGDGEQVEDFVFVEDVVRALVAAVGRMLASPPASFEPIDLGTGVGTPILEVLQRIRTLAESRSTIERTPKRPGSVSRRLVAGEARLELEGGYVALDQGLLHTIRAAAGLLAFGGSR